MNRYLVATVCGGLMERPDIEYENFDFIIAENEKIAIQIYNEKHKCSYFYGDVIGCIDDETNKLKFKKGVKKFLDRYCLDEIKDKRKILK